jgi:hypothetical protein
MASRTSIIILYVLKRAGINIFIQMCGVHGATCSLTRRTAMQPHAECNCICIISVVIEILVSYYDYYIRTCIAARQCSFFHGVI